MSGLFVGDWRGRAHSCGATCAFCFPQSLAAISWPFIHAVNQLNRTTELANLCSPGSRSVRQVPPRRGILAYCGSRQVDHSAPFIKMPLGGQQMTGSGGKISAFVARLVLNAVLVEVA